MQLCRLRSWLFLVMVLVLTASAALAAETISLTVDATKTQEKLLRSHEVIPVQPGPLTVYYPKWIPGEHGPNGPISSVTGLKFEAGGKVIPWKRDLLDAFTFHLDIPAGVKQLEATSLSQMATLPLTSTWSSNGTPSYSIPPALQRSS
jgi:hypothetical protein